MIKQYIQNQLNAPLTEKMVNQFDIYCDFLREENEKYNLTAITEPAEVWEKHFADSILGASLLPTNAQLCDVGSGAGFPALPLKIVRPDVSVTLVDSLQKRINFTTELCKKMDVDGTFVHARAEDFAQTHSEKFDVVTARAVAPLNILLEYTAQIVKIGGFVLAYKTDKQEALDYQNVAKELGLKFEAGHAFVLPSNSNRYLMVFRKVKATPKKYPRGKNLPRKNPLV